MERERKNDLCVCVCVGGGGLFLEINSLSFGKFQEVKLDLMNLSSINLEFTKFQ